MSGAAVAGLDLPVHGAGEPRPGFATVCAMFDHAVSTAPDTVAFRHLGASLTYREEGRAVVTPAKGAPVARLYTVLFVKRDGRWLMADVRETDDTAASPHDRLKELEWMIGQWVDESPEAVISTDCRWSDDKNFLLRSYTIQVAGVPAMSGVQRIGWDPITGQIKSWVFDSQGGHSEGLWSRDGNRWAVQQIPDYGA